MEAKIDALLRINAGEEGERIIDSLDHHFERTSGAAPHGHDQEDVKNAGRDVKHVCAEA